jgi:hypothetical protein
MTESLYALSDETRRIEATIQFTVERLMSDDPDEAEEARVALESLLATEESTRAALATKADAWCWVIDRFRAQAADRKAHGRRLTELARADEMKADRLQDQLVALLLRVDPEATRFELPHHQLTSRRSAAVEIDPELLPIDLPEEFQRRITRVDPDKDAIKQALKSGREVPGAQLVERRSWRIG